MKRGTPYHSACGRSPASSDETPVCSTSGATSMPAATSWVDQLRRKGAPGARHLRAAGRVRVDRLVALERPVARRVAVADRLAVAGEVVRHRLAEISAASQSRPTGSPGASRAASPGSARTSPSSPPSKRSRPARSSTSQTAGPRSGAGDDRCTRRSLPITGTAAGRVAEVLITSRSPGSSSSGSSAKRACSSSPDERRATSRRTSSRPAPRTSGGLARLGGLRRRGDHRAAPASERAA